ncbi:MAG: M20/M25/M40 family metallo-hydrolase [Pseudomonadota bacterium]
MGRWIALTAALAGALLLAWQGARTPAPVDAAAPATTFSAGRALVDIGVIARVPHPVASPANAQVRDYLVARMTALGLSPMVHASDGVDTRAGENGLLVLGAPVENIVGVLPGRDRTLPAVAVMAHYDSVEGSPGAADDATGVAAALEIARALKARGTPERDVVFLITDGEEAGLLGARAFFAEHPLRKRIGLVINMEARGGGGRANMFQTGPDNGALVRAFAKTAVKPISNSLAVFLYENMPNDTDFSVSKAAGIPGLNFAFIGRQFDYHSPTSTVANLDKGSVQHIGDQALAAALTFAFAPALPAPAPDAVYSQTFGDHILAYPAWGGWIVLLLAGGLIVLGAVRARKAGRLPFADTARGAGAALSVLVGAALLLQLARRATGVGFGFMEQRPLLAQWALWETLLAVLALGILLIVPAKLGRGGRRMSAVISAVTAGVLCSLFGGWDPIGLGLGVATALLAFVSFGRPVDLPGAWLGALATGLLVAIALQVALPPVALIVAWPLALAGVGAAATTLGTRIDAPRWALLALLGALGGGWLAVYFHGVAQGLDLPAALGLFAWLGALLFWPLAAFDGRRALWPALGLFGLGAILFLVVRFDAPWNARHPYVSNVTHVTDLAEGKAWRVSREPSPTAWTRAALGGAPARRRIEAMGPDPAWATPATPLPLPAATVDSSLLPDGDIRLRIQPPAGVRGLGMEITSKARFTLASVQDRPATTTAARDRLRVRWHGDRALELVLRPVRPGPGQLEVKHNTLHGGWPGSLPPLPPRPAGEMPFDLGDSAVTHAVTTATW